MWFLKNVTYLQKFGGGELSFGLLRHFRVVHCVSRNYTWKGGILCVCACNQVGWPLHRTILGEVILVVITVPTNSITPHPFLVSRINLLLHRTLRHTTCSPAEFILLNSTPLISPRLDGTKTSFTGNWAQENDVAPLYADHPR